MIGKYLDAGGDALIMDGSRDGSRSSTIFFSPGTSRSATTWWWTRAAWADCSAAVRSFRWLRILAASPITKGFQGSVSIFSAGAHRFNRGQKQIDSARRWNC